MYQICDDKMEKLNIYEIADIILKKSLWFI